MKNIFLFILHSLWFNLSIACTAFGLITNELVIIGKNRDASYYAGQRFELVMPQKQFSNWYDNKYNHKNKFYALLSNNDVKMGVNESGLAVIEEDPLYPDSKEFNRIYSQPINGNAEGAILYGVLQNFSTVDEIIPYVKQIFSVAAPNFYQISDNKKILIVEVGYGTSNIDRQRNFIYKVLQTKDEYFVHTNTYLSPKFKKFNALENNLYKIQGAEYRLNRIKWMIQNNPNDYLNWLMDTTSELKNPTDNNWCQNTSIFRSDLHGLEKAYVNMADHKIYGTASNFVVVNNIDPKKSIINLKIIENINVQKDGTQKIMYKELNMHLNELFKTNVLHFHDKEFIRSNPINGLCS